MSLADAEALTLRTLKQVMEEKLDENNVQLARVVPGQDFKILSTEELKQTIERAGV